MQVQIQTTSQFSASDNSLRNKACHFLLEGGLSDTAADALSSLTKESHLDDFIEEGEIHPDP